ncbi:MAG: pentapeptide repeat-containing protein, partial [Bacteroidota bacterium]
MKKNLIIGIALGGIIGWVFGYLKFPLVTEEYSFLMGVSMSAIIALLLFLIWSKYSFFSSELKKRTHSNQSISIPKNLFHFWMISFVFVVFLTSVFGIYLFKKNKDQKATIQEQRILLQQQYSLIEKVRNNNQMPLLDNILTHVREELNNPKVDTLSDELIARISALSYSFEPYYSLEGDSLSEKAYSPEKGQLLLSLSKMSIDSSSFHRIKLRTSFAHTKLKKANLRGSNLEEAKLEGADLSGADLRKAVLSNTNLAEGNLSGTDLQMANLKGANLKRVNLNWTDMDGAVLDSAYMSGTQLISARLKGASLKGVELRWADLTGVLLTKANLDQADIAGSNLKRGIFTNAILSNADLRYVDFTQADLSHTDLSQSDLKFAILKGANLSNANLEGAEVEY